MRSRACLVLALTMVLFGQASPSAGQGRGDPNGGDPAFQSPVVQSFEDLAPMFQGGQLDSVLGREVRTRVEEDAGRIIDLLADRGGRVRAAVIEFGGFLGIGTRKIAVEWSALRFESGAKQPLVIVDITRDQLRAAPEYKASEPVVIRRAPD